MDEKIHKKTELEPNADTEIENFLRKDLSASSYGKAMGVVIKKKRIDFVTSYENYKKE